MVMVRVMVMDLNKRERVNVPVRMGGKETIVPNCIVQKDATMANALPKTTYIQLVNVKKVGQMKRAVYLNVHLL